MCIYIYIYMYIYIYRDEYAQNASLIIESISEDDRERQASELAN